MKDYPESLKKKASVEKEKSYQTFESLLCSEESLKKNIENIEKSLLSDLGENGWDGYRNKLATIGKLKETMNRNVEKIRSCYLKIKMCESILTSRNTHTPLSLSISHPSRRRGLGFDRCQS